MRWISSGGLAESVSAYFSPPFFFVPKHFSKLRKKLNDDEEGTEMGKDVSGECDLTRSLARSFFSFLCIQLRPRRESTCHGAASAGKTSTTGLKSYYKSNH